MFEVDFSSCVVWGGPSIHPLGQWGWGGRGCISPSQPLKAAAVDPADPGARNNSSNLERRLRMGVRGAKVTGERLIHDLALVQEGDLCCPHQPASRTPASTHPGAMFLTSSWLGATVLTPRAWWWSPKTPFPASWPLGPSQSPACGLSQRDGWYLPPSMVVTLK